MARLLFLFVALLSAGSIQGLAFQSIDVLKDHRTPLNVQVKLNNVSFFCCHQLLFKNLLKEALLNRLDRLETELKAKAERLEQLEEEQIKMKSDYLTEIVQLKKRIQQLESAESSSKNHWQDQNGNNKKEAVDGLISSGA